jgi:hypothetical protein
MIITLSGTKRSGKSTAAKILTNNFNFTEIALADPLRYICSKVFDIPVETFLSDELKEQSFEYPVTLNSDYLGHIEAIIENEWQYNINEAAHIRFSQHEGQTFANPRQILQYVGTELIRGEINDNIFLELANRRIENIEGNVVVSDVRFELEQMWAKNKGALMVLIKRPTLDLPKDTHVSENQLNDETNFNTVIMNDEGLSRFQIELFSYFSYVLRSR